LNGKDLFTGILANAIWEQKIKKWSDKNGVNVEDKGK
jgi:hypothetical protein